MKRYAEREIHTSTEYGQHSSNFKSAHEEKTSNMAEKLFLCSSFGRKLKLFSKGKKRRNR